MREGYLSTRCLWLRRRLLHWGVMEQAMALTRNRKVFIFIIVIVVLWVILTWSQKSWRGHDEFLSGLSNEQARRMDVIRHVVHMLPRDKNGVVQQLADHCCSFGPWSPVETEDRNRHGQSSSYQSIKSRVSDSSSSSSSSSTVQYDLMDRDITWHEDWPEVEVDAARSPQYPTALHYVWCGPRRQFTFGHYLGLLSGYRVLKPLKVFFHYTHGPPVMDSLMYNSWFEEFKQFVPVLHTHQLNSPQADCGSKAMLNLTLDLLARHGGLYLGEKVVLAGLPGDLLRLSSWSALADDSHDWTQGVIYVKQPLTTSTHTSPLSTKLHRRSVCLSVDEFNLRGHGENRKCVIIRDQPKYPRDIWSADTGFAELARWLFYGRREAFRVQRDPRHPIPRISHYIRVQDSGKPMYQEEFSFNHFISVLSALYVGGFSQVYLHVDQAPTGRWWQLLQRENITVLQLQKPDLVYQQRITGITHFSDVSRYNVLSRYGGVYQDFDCVWTTRVPDHILEYPVVVSPAISRNGLWPDGLAIGMLMARPGAPFLRHAFKGYRQYHGENYLYNAIMRSYRTYEHYPDSLLFEPHFTVFCVDKRCLPTWLHGDFWDLTKDGGRAYNWSGEALALHIPIPKPTPAFASPRALRDSRDLFGDLGRMVLRKSGRLEVLNHD